MNYIKTLLFIMNCLSITSAYPAPPGKNDLAATANNAVIYGSEYQNGYDWGKTLLPVAPLPYKSLPGRQDRDVIVDWRSIVTVNEISLDFISPVNIVPIPEFRSKSPEAFRPIPEAEEIRSNNKIIFRFPSISTSAIRIRFTRAQTETPLEIRKISVFGPDSSVVESNWHGVWIWGNPEQRNIVLRREFYIDHPDSLRGAWVQAAADDWASLRINDQVLGPASFRQPKLFDIKNFLKPGKNIITARADDTGGAYGFLAEIILDHGTEVEYLPTGDGWEYSVPGSSQWNKVFKVHNTPPDCPWGEISYINPLLQESVLTIDDIDIPRMVKPGSEIAGKLRLRLSRPLLTPISLTLSLDGGELNARNLEIAKATSAIPLKQPSGVDFDVPFQMYVGEFAPDGEIPLNISVSGDRKCRIGYSEKSSKSGTVRIVRFPETADAPAAFPEIEIRKTGDSPVLYVNKEPVPLVIHTNFHLGYRTMHEYAKTGVKIYRISAFEGQIITSPEHQRQSLDASFKTLEHNIDIILRYQPDALLILSTMLRTAPSWGQAYPDEVAVRSDGLKSVHQSVASEQWRRDAEYCISELIRYAATRPWGKQVIGYTFLTGGGGEFHHYVKSGGLVPREQFQVSCLSNAARKGFRQYLRKQYRTDEALQAAWNNAQVTLDTAEITREMITEEAAAGFLSDPAKQRARLDYFDFYSAANAENLLTCCRAVKKHAKYNVLAGGYLGYWFNTCMQYPGGAQESGHAGFIDVISQPEVDFISLPYAYFNRQTGTAPFAGQLYSSLLIRNKLSIQEYDMRTHIANLDAAAYGQRSLRDAEEVLKRDVGYALTKGPGFGWWWLDFSAGRKGQNSIPWYDHPQLIDLMKQSNALAAQATRETFVNHSEIAVFYDMRSTYRFDIFASVPAYNTVYSAVIKAVSAIGAPVDFYDLRDIELDMVQKKYKMYIFANAYLLSAEQRETIRTKLQRDNKTLVWMWAPGFLETDKMSIANMTEVTGFQFEAAPGWQTPVIELNPETRLGKNAGRAMSMNDWHISFFANRPFYNKKLAPVFYVKDADCEVAGVFSGFEKPGLVFKDFGTWKSIYCGIPNWEPEVLRNVARLSGVHLYSEAPLVSCNAGGDFIMLHNRLRITAATLRLPGKHDIYDAFSGECLAKDTDRLPLKLQPGETRVFQLKK